MIKKLLVILFMLVGCTTTQVDIKEKVTIQFFYLQTCSECKAFKEEAIPYLEKTFGENIEIHQYDLDDSKNTEIYDSYVDRIEYFDEEFYGWGPFVVVDDYFAVLGYNLGDEELLVQDIIHAVNGEKLCDELEGMRFELLKEANQLTKYHLDFFYASSCPRCELFKEDVIPELEKKYNQQLVITLHNIDDEETIDLYAKTISCLEGYKVDDHTGSVPFIVFDGAFVKVGYNQENKDILLKNIDNAMNDKEIEVLADYYLFKENKTLY